MDVPISGHTNQCGGSGKCEENELSGFDPPNDGTLAFDPLVIDPAIKFIAIELNVKTDFLSIVFLLSS